MAITDSLVGFPVVNQINERAASGAVEINDNDDCVPCSIAPCITQLTGVHHTGSELKDTVYGVGYKGPTDPARYESYAAALGVQMTAEYGDPAQLVQIIHQEIAAGHPVLVTMPWPWDNAAQVQSPGVLTYGVTHEGAACGVGPGWIRVMNPWGGFFQDQPDSWWQARLCYGKVYVCKKVGVPAPVQVAGGHTIMTLSLADPVVSRYFKQDGDGWRCEVAPGVLIRGGMLSFYQTVPAPGSYAGLSLLGLPQTDETDVPGKPGVKVTLFERGAVAWDVNHELDHPVGVNGPVYLIHREQVAQFFPSKASASADAQALQAQLANVQAQLTQALTERQQAKTQLTDIESQVQAANAEIQRLQAEMGQSQAAGGPALTQAQDALAAAQQRLEQATQEHTAKLAELNGNVQALTDTHIQQTAALQVAEKRLSLIELVLAAPSSAMPALNVASQAASTEPPATENALSASVVVENVPADASVAADVPNQEATPAPSEASAAPDAEAESAPADVAPAPETLDPTEPALDAVPAQPAPEAQSA